jgi:hypothetical protein
MVKIQFHTNVVFIIEIVSEAVYVLGDGNISLNGGSQDLAEARTVFRLHMVQSEIIAIRSVVIKMQITCRIPVAIVPPGSVYHPITLGSAPRTIAWLLRKAGQGKQAAKKQDNYIFSFYRAHIHQ